MALTAVDDCADGHAFESEQESLQYASVVQLGVRSMASRLPERRKTGLCAPYLYSYVCPHSSSIEPSNPSPTLVSGCVLPDH
jgi:hypothetical protein